MKGMGKPYTIDVDTESITECLFRKHCEHVTMGSVH